MSEAKPSEQSASDELVVVGDHSRWLANREAQLTALYPSERDNYVVLFAGDDRLYGGAPQRRAPTPLAPKAKTANDAARIQRAEMKRARKAADLRNAAERPRSEGQ